MSFELRDHTADVAVAAEGESLGETFAAVADGLAAAMCDEVPAGGEQYPVGVHSEGKESLLFDYLDDLIYQRDIEHVLPVDNACEVFFKRGKWVLRGSFRGVPLDRVSAREVKAVTYSDMRVERTADGYEAYVVLDV
ncbi:archease [Haloglomus halophilum]|uniref:archease n=1 Tax=Haloglomus halophilum TaxID=2962672 RepID=UPI0020C9ACCF|nr:archease [Haloglomus halophilum]